MRALALASRPPAVVSAIVATGLLLWNLMGAGAYLMQATADLDALAQTDPDTAATFAAMPAERASTWRSSTLASRLNPLIADCQ